MVICIVMQLDFFLFFVLVKMLGLSMSVLVFACMLESPMEFGKIPMSGSPIPEILI